MLRKLAGSFAALALVATPLAAEQAAVETSRDAAPVAGESALVGQSTLYFVLGIAAVIAAIVFLSEDDDPVSA